MKEYISAVYSLIKGDSYQAVLGGGHASYQSLLYELGRMGNESASGFAYNETADGGVYSAIWTYYYKICYWCSMIIEQLPANHVASDDLKQRVTAEARALRAIAMMNLVQLYGNPPLADHVIKGTEGNTPAEQSWAFIEKELTEAAEQLPSKSGLGDQKTIGGRLTREACYAYLGKAQLWQKKYNDAAQTLYNKVIATGKYALDEDYNTLNSSANDFSDENIWEFNFSDEQGAEKTQEGCFDLACFSPDLGYYSTTYGSLLLTFGMGAYPSEEFANFMQQHDATMMGTSARYNATLCDYGTALMSAQAYFTTFPYNISNCQGYFRVKGTALAGDIAGEFPYFFTKRNTVYMRYAEVLLNYAEAVAMGGQQGALSGLEALNMVRQRAGIEAAPELTMDNAQYGVKAERRAEFFGEGMEFIDLVRWGDAPKVLADCGKKIYTCSITQGEKMNIPGIGEIQLYNTDVTNVPSGGQGFKAGKNELFPIPATDKNTNPNLTQNPNW